MLDAKKVKIPGKYVNGVPKGKQKNCEFYRVNKLPEHEFDGFIKAWYVKIVHSVKAYEKFFWHMEVDIGVLLKLIIKMAINHSISLFTLC